MTLQFVLTGTGRQKIISKNLVPTLKARTHHQQHHHGDAFDFFGVSSDEYLNYAQNNRREWELRGKEMVNSYVEKLKNAAGDI